MKRLTVYPGLPRSAPVCPGLPRPTPAYPGLPRPTPAYPGLPTCLEAASSSRPSPTTTYVHFRPKRDTIRSKQLSFPDRQNTLISLSSSMPVLSEGVPTQRMRSTRGYYLVISGSDQSNCTGVHQRQIILCIHCICMKYILG